MDLVKGLENVARNIVEEKELKCLKYALGRQEELVHLHYEKIGALVYQKYLDLLYKNYLDKVDIPKDLLATCKETNVANDVLKEMSKKISQLKLQIGEAGIIHTCPACGEKVIGNVNYCPYCGKKLKETAPTK